MTHEKAQSRRCSKAIKEFRAQYPSATSADLQTFIIAYREGEKAMLEESKRMLMACLFFFNANSNQGLRKIKGIDVDEQIQTVIDAVLLDETGCGRITEVIRKLL